MSAKKGTANIVINQFGRENAVVPEKYPNGLNTEKSNQTRPLNHHNTVSSNSIEEEAKEELPNNEEIDSLFITYDNEIRQRGPEEKTRVSSEVSSLSRLAGNDDGGSSSKIRKKKRPQGLNYQVYAFIREYRRRMRQKSRAVKNLAKEHKGSHGKLPSSEVTKTDSSPKVPPPEDNKCGGLATSCYDKETKEKSYSETQQTESYVHTSTQVTSTIHSFTTFLYDEVASGTAPLHSTKKEDAIISDWLLSIERPLVITTSASVSNLAFTEDSSTRFPDNPVEEDPLSGEDETEWRRSESARKDEKSWLLFTKGYGEDKTLLICITCLVAAVAICFLLCSLVKRRNASMTDAKHSSRHLNNDTVKFIALSQMPPSITEQNDETDILKC